MSKPLYKVVVVGGGFGGVKAALELAGHEGFKVALISDHDHMRIYGNFYLTATGGSKRASTLPLEEIFANKKVDVIYGKVSNLDRKAQTVSTEDGQSFHYNALVLAMGVRTNYFGIEGLEEYSLGIKSLEEAEELKNHLHKQLVEDGRQDLNYVVVGGGPSGVELSGVLPAYVRQIAKWHNLPNRKIHVDLIEAAPRLLPRMPKSLSRRVKVHLIKQGVKVYLKTAVEAQTADALMVRGKPIRSHTVVWTAGMSNNPFFNEHEFQLSRSGKVRVDHFLQSEPAIYVIGDNADTPYSGMAQTALYDGHFIARNLVRIAGGKAPRPYVAKKPVYVMPAGPEWAAVLWGPVKFYGRLGWALRRVADFVAYRDYEPWQLALKHFMAENEREESCPMCADDLAR